MVVVDRVRQVNEGRQVHRHQQSALAARTRAFGIGGVGGDSPPARSALAPPSTGMNFERHYGLCFPHDAPICGTVIAPRQTCTDRQRTR